MRRWRAGKPVFDCRLDVGVYDSAVNTPVARYKNGKR
jgi:hypothetical protein